MKGDETLLYSWLFIPGNKEKHLQKAYQLNADALIFDLEDAVPSTEKEKARKHVVQTIQKLDNKNNFIRVNELASDYFLDDLEKMIIPNVNGVVLPKVNNRGDIAIADYLIGKFERKNGLKNGAISIVPIIETAEGIHKALEIAQASTRIKRLAFGAEDFMLDLNIYPDESESELLYARSQLVVASREARIEPPIDSIYTDFRDEDGLKTATERGKRFGFRGKLLIHPDQIETVNNIFVPTTKEIAEAKKIVQAYEEAIRVGQGAIQVDGKMIDVPIYERAKKMLKHHEKRTLK